MEEPELTSNVYVVQQTMSQPPTHPLPNDDNSSPVLYLCQNEQSVSSNLQRISKFTVLRAQL